MGNESHSSLALINNPNPLPYRCSLPAKAAYDHGAGIVYSAPQRLAVAERFQVSDELLGMRWGVVDHDQRGHPPPREEIARRAPQ